MSNNLTEKLKKKLKTPGLISNFASRIKSEFIPILREEGKFLERYGFDYSDIKKIVSETEKKLDESIEKSQSPLKVSLIGPFSSGKTITLCALLKKPRMLPSSAAPTSGNVVEIQVVPPDDSEELNQVKCILFSQSELEAMLRDYYSWLHSKFPEKVKLNDLPERDGFLKQKIAYLKAEVEEEIKPIWIRCKKENLAFTSLLKGLSHLYFILVTVNRYFSKYQDINESETSRVLSFPFKLDDGDFQNKLKAVTHLGMEWSLNMMHPEKLEESVDAFWRHTPDTPELLHSSCENGSISPEALRAMFPLYKRIVLTEKMDISEGWGGAERISFLDFPGLDSGNRRDVYLCLKELASAHANILFFMADRPTVRDAQNLIEIVSEAKSHLKQLSERIIPVINFFDAYENPPENVNLEDTIDEPPEKALRRVENFFAKGEIAGEKTQGFNLFDERILSHLGIKGDWRYHLLAPAASMDQGSLSEKEKRCIRNYEDYKGRYGQLFKDLEISIGELKKDRSANKDNISKYEDLYMAIKAYHEDGGIEALRGRIVSKLRAKGTKLIAEDARHPLMQAMEELEGSIISPLEEKDIDIDEPETEDRIEREEVRREVIALWEQMRLLTEEWRRSGEFVTLEYKKTASSLNKAAEYISPLKICESKVLQEVLKDSFWDELSKPNDTIEDKPLSELAERYNEMMSSLKEWGDKAFEEILEHTLEKLDRTKLRLETDQDASFHDLRNTLFDEYVDEVASVGEGEKQILRELFSLKSMHEAIYRRLIEKRQEKNKRENDISGTLPNEKVPFNENLIFSWSSFEVMKIQRQMIMTLQRCITSDFAFYISIFFKEFQRELRQRLDDLKKYSNIYEKPDNLFDQLAAIRREESKEPDELSIREQREKAKEIAMRILNLWEMLT